MIEEHEHMQPPTDDTVLWRFMDFTKYVSLLHTQSLWFTQATRMEDNYECRYTAPDMQHSRAMWDSIPLPAEIKGQLPHNVAFLSEMARRTFYLSCWHMNRHESAAMWRLYLLSHEGVAIRTTYSSVKASLAQTTDPIFATIVKYIDYQSESIGMGNVFKPVAFKRKSFEHEAEMRLIWWSIPQYPEFTGPGGYDQPGHPIPVLLGELIQDVFVSPKAEDWFREVVESVTRKYGLGCQVTKSNLYTDPIY